MIDGFVDSLNQHEGAILDELHGLVDANDWYEALSAELLLGIFARHHEGDRYASTTPTLDPERITRIDHGDYQGTIVLVIAEEGYQPWQHFAVAYSYGSCSGCDALDAVASSPADEQPALYFAELRTIVQGLVPIHHT